jgi:hypothetical protein
MKFYIISQNSYIKKKIFLILITKKRDEARLEILDDSKLKESNNGKILSKVQLLEDRNDELLNQVKKLEGIRGALEEKVSAYRYRLKEITKQLEETQLPPTQDEVVYHNKDNLDRRRFILRGRLFQKGIEKRSKGYKGDQNVKELQEKYDRLLEQYMYEHDKSEALFDYLFQKEGNFDLELFARADAADTLLEATRLSRTIIQQAENHVQSIKSVNSSN